MPLLPGHPRYPGGVELVCHHAAGGVEVDPRGEREAIASGACRPLRPEREVAPGATQPRPRNGPGAAIGRSTAVRPGRAGAGAMCACRSPTAATRGRPRPALRWKTPPTGLTVGTGLGRSRRIGSGPGGAPQPVAGAGSRHTVRCVRWNGDIRQKFIILGVPHPPARLRGPEAFEHICSLVIDKKPELASAVEHGNLRLVRFSEGTCAQIMHKGPYDDEPATIAKLSSFVADQNLRLDIGNASGSDPQDILGFLDCDGVVPRICLHHEIYLGDPRRMKPENLKTVIRHPIA